jgi:hypothetical protein
MLGPGCATIRHADYVRSDAPTAMTFDRPRIRIDRASSGLHLTYDIAQTQRYDREEVLAAIEALWNQGKPADAPVAPARVFVRGSIVDERGWLWAIASVYFYPAWVLLAGPTYSSTANVDIDIEVKGSPMLTGSGSGKCYAGLWYPGDPSACAFDKAIVDAFQRGAL